MFRKRSRFWIIAALVLCTSLATTSWGRANEEVTEFNIPPQPLDSALLVFAEQADVQVSVSTVVITGMRTQGVVGRFTPSVALARLLNETGLQFSTVGDRTYSVSLAGNSNRVTTEGVEASDAEGASIWVGGATRLAQGPDAGDSTASAPPAAQQGDSLSGRDDAAYLGDTIVTGSRLRRSGDDGPAPVIVFDQQRIKQLGVTNVADVLNYLPQQPFSTNEQTNFGGSRVVRLRGLGLGTTLVLINGRRTVTSALNSAGNFFDLNSVPLTAVERIEVLSDSASAIYGADAVGGVVNIILKTGVDEPSVGLYYGAADGGADERRLSIFAGSSTDRFRSALTLDAFDRGTLLGEERDLYANQDYRRFGSMDRRSVFSNPGNVNSVTSSNLPGLPSRFAAVPLGSTGVGLTPEDFLATAGQRNLYSAGRLQSVVPETTRFSGTALLGFDLTERTSVFAEALYTNRDDTRLTGAALLNETVPAANPFNPFGVPVLVNYRFTALGSQRDTSDAELFRAVAGLQGELNTSWDWELSALSTDEDGSASVLNSIDTALARAAVRATDPGQALNVFQDGPGGSPALLASLARDSKNTYSSSGVQGGAFVRGRLFAARRAGAIEMVVGGEARKERVLFDNTQTTSGLFASADRRSWSVYSELRMPLVSREMSARFAGQLALTLAGRYDHYSDFGSTFNPQYGVEWHPISQLLVRASYGTSFRPASLFELHLLEQVSPATFIDPRRNNEATPGLAITGGNPDLQPEESDSITFGVVLTPWGDDALRLEASYWLIEQDQRIQRFGPSFVLASERFFSDRIVRSTPTAADLAAGLPGRLVSVDATGINFGRLETSGIDLQVSHSFATALGNLAPTLGATWVEKYEAVDLPNTPVIDRVGVAHSLGTVPEWRATLGVAWSRRGWGLSTTARYISSYDDANNLNARNGRMVDSQTIVDIQGSIDFDELFAVPLFSGMEIRVGITNLFDEQPHFSEISAFGFDPNQADTRQRFGYVSLSKAF